MLKLSPYFWVTASVVRPQLNSGVEGTAFALVFLMALHLQLRGTRMESLRVPPHVSSLWVGVGTRTLLGRLTSNYRAH